MKGKKKESMVGKGERKVGDQRKEEIMNKVLVFC